MSVVQLLEKENKNLKEIKKKQSGTRKNTAGLLRTAWLHVFCVLR